jgi:hypothetical protein
VAGHLETLRRFDPEYAEAYAALNRLAARVLAHDALEGQKDLPAVTEKKKAKATGGRG